MKNITVFNNEWVECVQSTANDESWAKDAVDNIDTDGGVYLSVLRMWFNKYPVSDKDKKKLVGEIENFENNAHLGAVNLMSCRGGCF